VIPNHRRHSRASLRPFHTSLRSRAAPGLAQGDRVQQGVLWLTAPDRGLLVGHVGVSSRLFLVLAAVTQQRQYSLFKLSMSLARITILLIVVAGFALSLALLIQSYPYVFHKPLE
jgi:hypothetical protein